MQISIEESLTAYKSVTFQIALLYTSSKGMKKNNFIGKNCFVMLGERRIRVHTLSLPVSANLTDICSNADQEAVVSLVAKMGKLKFCFFE